MVDTTIQSGAVPAENKGQERASALSNGKLAMLLFMSTEVMFFTALLGAYIVLRFSHSLGWPQQQQMHVDWRLGSINTLLLTASSLTLWLAVRAAKSGLATKSKSCLFVTLLLAVAFVSIKGFEYWEKYEFGLFPTTSGRLIFNEADETYLSRTVKEIRKGIADAESGGLDEARLSELYEIQSGVVDWTQYKVGQLDELSDRSLAIAALAYQILPGKGNAVLDQYLDHELRQTKDKRDRFQVELKNAEAALKNEQAKLKKLLPNRSKNPESQQEYAEVSRGVERITERMTAINKDLGPIEARISVSDSKGSGINERFGLKLPMVIPNGKTWVDTYFLLTGFHAVHLFAGMLIMSFWLFVPLGKSRAHLLENFSVYWHFVDLVWLVIFVIIYLY